MWKEVSEKEPINTGELFCRLYEHLLEQHKIPNILEYHLPVTGSERVVIVSDEFDIRFELMYGGSEGIYLDVYADGEVTKANEHKRYPLGTFKTLEEDDCSMHTMAVLGADLICEGKRFLHQNSDDFIFTGYKVMFFRDGNADKPLSACYIASKESLIEFLKRYLEDDTYTLKHNITSAIIRDNKTRLERVISKEEFACNKESFFRTRADVIPLLACGERREVIMTNNVEVCGMVVHIDEDYFAIVDEDNVSDRVTIYYDEVAKIA